MIKKLILENKLLLQKLVFGFASALVVVVFSVILTDLLYQTKNTEKRGYQIDVTSKSETTNIGGVAVGDLPKAGGKIPANTTSKKTVDIAELLKTADANAGSKVAKKCAACHTFEQGGANKVGPNLFGAVGRKKAAISGFAYSDAMKKKGGNWTIEDLNQFLAKPKDFVPGTKMGFAGIKKDQDRANVIAYLKTKK